MMDIAIVGGGPAGLSAAVNIVARNRTAVVFGRKAETSALWRAERVDNHLGMPRMTGREMIQAFQAHAQRQGIRIHEGRVMQIMPMGSHFALNVENEFMEAKAVILAMGMEKGVKIPGENEFLGRGVSYCATCDGMLYRGKKVALSAETEEGVEDANFLAEVCEKVYFYGKEGEEHTLDPRVVRLDQPIRSVAGGEYVAAAVIGEQTVSVDGVFFIKATTPVNSLLYGLELKDNSIVVSRQMETSVPGVFACGDVTGRPFQLSKAIGEGQIAGQSAARYVS